MGTSKRTQKKKNPRRMMTGTQCRIERLQHRQKVQRLNPLQKQFGFKQKPCYLNICRITLSNQTMWNQTMSNQTISSQTETISKTKLEVATFVSWGGIVLRECEGHCWDDYECEGDLVCFKRSLGRGVNLGCSGYEKMGQNVHF